MGKNREEINKTGKALTVIAQGTLANGTFKEAGEIVVHGCLEGEINSSESITVTPSGVVGATVTSNRIYINGYVRGTLHTEALHLDSQARLVGDVHTPSLEVAEGAVFHGSCFMPDEIAESQGQVIPLTRSA